MDSISKFQESGISTDHYLLIHNRDGKNRDFANEIESALKKLLSSGSATKVALWDRQRFLGEVFAFVGDLLEQRLREYSRQTLTRFQELFRFGRCRVSSVPVTESRMKLKRNSPAVLEEMVEQDALEISWHLKTQKGVPRWSILVGNFGLGKTAAALHLGIQSDRVVIHVPCAVIPGEVFRGGNTASLVKEIIALSKMMDDELKEQDEETNKIWTKIATAVLRYRLRLEPSPYLLILDGLDEHHVFARLGGLQGLVSQLNETRSQVILTTRSEHMISMREDFALAFSGLATKYGNEISFRVLELKPWAAQQVSQFVEMAIRQEEGRARALLEKFLLDIREGRAVESYGDLLDHPLFLQFIVEEVAEGGVQSTSRTELLRRWVDRKIRRDQTPGIGIARSRRVSLEVSFEEYLRGIFLGMELIAGKMIVSSDKGFVLSESLSFSETLDLLSGALGRRIDQLLPVLLNSMLIPHQVAESDSPQVGFALRILQEYFLARHLVRSKESRDGLPETVRTLVAELDDGVCF